MNPYEGLLIEAADKIEQLQKLIDDSTNDHFVDTLDFYAERCRKFEEIATELVTKSSNTCDYCKHKIPCRGEECEKYLSGRGCHDEKGRYIDWKWDCMDFEFGECDMLIDTPCKDCIKNDNKGFEWTI